METDMNDTVTVKKQIALDQILNFKFPVDNFICDVQESAHKFNIKAINEIVLELKKKYGEKENLHKLCADASEEFISNFDNVIQLRGEELRDYFNTSGTFNSFLNGNLDSIKYDDENLYNKENDLEVEHKVKELLEKKHTCYLLKKKISEIKLLNKDLTNLLSKTEE